MFCSCILGILVILAVTAEWNLKPGCWRKQKLELDFVTFGSAVRSDYIEQLDEKSFWKLLD